MSIIFWVVFTIAVIGSGIKIGLTAKEMGMLKRLPKWLVCIMFSPIMVLYIAVMLLICLFKSAFKGSLFDKIFALINIILVVYIIVLLFYCGSIWLAFVMFLGFYTLIDWLSVYAEYIGCFSVYSFNKFMLNCFIISMVISMLILVGKLL